MRQKLSEFLLSEVPGVDIEIIKKVVKAFRRYEFNHRGNFCDICYIPITWEDQAGIRPRDFHYTCKDHRQYGEAYNLVVVRRDLGITIDNIHPIDI